jgi:hypothetical protein
MEFSVDKAGLLNLWAKAAILSTQCFHEILLDESRVSKEEEYSKPIEGI